MNLVTLKKEHSLVLKETITEYLSPNYIYLPIKSNSKFKIDPKSYLHRGELLYDLIYSPISGKILGLKECDSVEGRKKFLVIENDFKEKTLKKVGVRKNISKISKSELIELLSSYDTDLLNEINKNYNKIIINSVDEQPYVGNFMYINVKYGKEILDLIDSLGDILNINDIEVIIKDTDYNTINALNNIIGMYNNVRLRLVPDKYMISNINVLTKYLDLKEEFMYLDIEEVYDLYQYLKRKKLREDKFITITGNLVDKPQVIKCKLGSSLKDIINDIIKITEKDYVVLVNNLLTSNKINIDNYIVTEGLKAVFIMKKNEIKELSCINCGKCNDVCPVKIKVSALVNGRKCDKKDCIHCGLCSYICPSFININKFLDGDKHE